MNIILMSLVKGYTAPKDGDPYMISKKGKKPFDPSQALPHFSQEGHGDYQCYLTVLEALEPVCSWIAALVSIISPTMILFLQLTCI